MKRIFIFCLTSFIVLSMSAQTPSFVKSDNVVNLGIGFGGNLYSGYYGAGLSRMPAISIAYENCIKDNLWDEKSSLGIGGMFGFASAHNDYWKSTNIIIGARGALHYAFVDKLDTYTGLMLGYDIVTWKWKGTDWGSAGASGFTWSWFIGARYYFTEKFAAFAELGYGVAIFNLGVSLKF